MTTEERLNHIELMLSNMQTRIDSLAANLEDVTLQLNKALEKINLFEEKQRHKSKIVSSAVFKGRLN